MEAAPFVLPPSRDNGANLIHAPECPSVGSIGHPHACKLACKYFGKKGGCKDGRMCLRCHLCVWRRQHEKVPASDVPWDPFFYAHSPKEFSVVAVHTPDPPVVLHHLHEDHDGKGLPSTARTPLQAGNGHWKLAETMADELSQKLRSLQLHQGMDLEEEPSTRDGLSPGSPQGGGSGSDPCTTHETEGVVAIALLPSPMKLAVPHFITAPEMQPVQGLFASAEDVQDEGVIPPPPLPVSLEDCGFQKTAITFSLSAVGHPFNCGPPCKYARRMGGCKNGDACLNCHQCKWARDRSKAVPGLVSSLSAGSAGHPEHCGQPCRYVRRKTGCSNGAHCPDCHLCQWRRQTQADEKDVAPAGEPEKHLLSNKKPSRDALASDKPNIHGLLPTPQVAPNRVASTVSDLWPSVGSLGHPYTCAGQGCKYFMKARGCKDGKLCTRCHLCRWSRYETSAVKPEILRKLCDGDWTHSQWPAA